MAPRTPHGRGRGAEKAQVQQRAAPRPKGECIASDGLRARDNGEWGREKLAFLDWFAPLALKATVKKRERHYVDLFAGPGCNVIRNTTQEFTGSPIRALQVAADKDSATHFTDAWFINLSRLDDVALRARIAKLEQDGGCRLDPSRVHAKLGDANALVRDVLDHIHPQAYALVFADMEAPKQCHWETIAALRTHRGHTSVDLYALFPLDMALRRLLSNNHDAMQQTEPTLTAFYGDERWREAARFRATGSDGDKQALGRKLLELYVERLREHWSHVEVVADVRRGMSHRMYKMLFASDDDAGKRIARWARGRAADQLRFL